MVVASYCHCPAIATAQPYFQLPGDGNQQTQTMVVASYCHCPAVFPATRRRQPALRKLRSILLTPTQNLLPSLITLPTYPFLLLLLPILPEHESFHRNFGIAKQLRSFADNSFSVFLHFTPLHLCDPDVCLPFRLHCLHDCKAFKFLTY
jgi:hypothetical protein